MLCPVDEQSLKFYYEYSYAHLKGDFDRVDLRYPRTALGFVARWTPCSLCTTLCFLRLSSVYRSCLCADCKEHFRRAYNQYVWRAVHRIQHARMMREVCADVQAAGLHPDRILQTGLIDTLDFFM